MVIIKCLIKYKCQLLIGLVFEIKSPILRSWLILYLNHDHELKFFSSLLYYICVQGDVYSIIGNILLCIRYIL